MGAWMYIQCDGCESRSPRDVLASGVYISRLRVEMRYTGWIRMITNQGARDYCPPCVAKRNAAKVEGAT